MAAKTSSTHRSAFVQATHRLDILGYSMLKSLGVRTSVRSGTFDGGGFPWTLICRFDEIVKDGIRVGAALKSIWLELSKNESDHDVVAMVSLRIDEAAGTGQFPAAVWRSDKAKIFRSWSRDATCELSVPDAFRDHEARYVDADADRLTIHCTVDVLRQDTAVAAVATRDWIVSLPPPPSIARDFHKLLRGRFMPDVTFVVEDTEIPAHRLVLAMRSSVFRAQFFGGGDMKDRCTRRIVIDDDMMSASNFRAMLYFIYTDEQPRPKRGGCGVAMAQDLLVAADLYDLERLRLMCEKILSENIDADNVMTTLMQAHGRHGCGQVEASCIEFLTSNPYVYEAVQATEEYRELEKDCSAFIHEVTKKVATRAVARSSTLSSTSSSSLLHPHKSMSRYNPSTVFRGTHEFMIGNLSAARKRRHDGFEYIQSGTFQVGGYGWAIEVYLWNKEEDGDKKEEHIGVYLVLLSAPVAEDAVNAKVSGFFRIYDPNGKSPAFSREFGQVAVYTKVGESKGIQRFIAVESATSQYLGHDGSLTISGEFQVATGSDTSTANTNVGAAIVVPPTDLAWHLEQLLASEQGSDVKFLVQESEIRGHRLVIAARSPVLHEEVESATNADHVRINDINVLVFKAMLHFIYTDELPLLDNLDLSAGDFTTMAGDMLAAACRFRIERMKRLCMNLLAEKVVTVSNALATVKVARHHNLPELEEYCKRYMSLPHVSSKVTDTCIRLFLESQLA